VTFIALILVALQAAKRIGLQQHALVMLVGCVALPLVGTKNVAVIDRKPAGGQVRIEIATGAVLDQEVFIAFGRAKLEVAPVIAVTNRVLAGNAQINLIG